MNEAIKRNSQDTKTLMDSVTLIHNQQQQVADREAARQVIGQLPKRTPEELDTLNSTLEKATPPVKAYFVSRTIYLFSSSKNDFFK